MTLSQSIPSISVVDINNLEIETERLILRRFKSDDLDSLYKLRNQGDVVRYLYEEEQTLDETRRTLDKRLEMNSLNKDNDTFI